MRAAATGAKTVIKSIRVDSSLERRLAAVSKKKNMTESAYVSGALRKELTIEPLSPAFDGITIERVAFRSIIDLANREAIDLLGAEVARRDIPLVFDLLDLKVQKRSVLDFLNDIAADCWHWFKIGLNPEGETRIVLYHQFGLKWSFFLKSFIVEAFALVSEAPPRITVTETVVKVDWSGNAGLGVLEKVGWNPARILDNPLN
jgi:hypothetical protein